MNIDFETYSEAGKTWDGQRWHGRGLLDVGAAAYAEHLTTEVISLAYGGQLWTPGRPDPEGLFLAIDAGAVVEAWNAQFEYFIWNSCCVWRYGWPRLPLRQMRCTMGRARAYSLPGRLAEAGRVLAQVTDV